MIKKVYYVIFFILLFALILAIANNTKQFFASITNTLSIWLYYVYPSIFTFYILSSFLINLNIIRKITFIFKPFISFEAEKAYELFFIAILVGNPSASSLTIKELEFNTITEKDANKLIKVCSFFNPLFIISLFSVGIFANNRYAYLIIVVILITNILLSKLFNKNVEKVKTNNDLIIFKPDKILSSINDSLYLLIQVAGVMVFVNIIKFSLLNLFDYINLESFILNFIIANLEISTGAIEVIKANANINITIALLTFLISFQGLSINLQVYNVIKTHYKLLPILLIRLIQASITSVITYLILTLT